MFTHFHLCFSLFIYKFFLFVSRLFTHFKIVFLTKSQVSVERHLVNDALAYLPIHGNNTGACSLIVLFIFGLNVFESSCNLPGVCGPCVLRREKLVSYLFVFCCFIYIYVCDSFFFSFTHLCVLLRIYILCFVFSHTLHILYICNKGYALYDREIMLHIYMCIYTFYTNFSRFINFLFMKYSEFQNPLLFCLYS